MIGRNEPTNVSVVRLPLRLFENLGLNVSLDSMDAFFTEEGAPSPLPPDVVLLHFT